MCVYDHSATRARETAYIFLLIGNVHSKLNRSYGSIMHTVVSHKAKMVAYTKLFAFGEHCSFVCCTCELLVRP